MSATRRIKVGILSQPPPASTPLEIEDRYRTQDSTQNEAEHGAPQKSYPQKNIFLFWPNIIGYIRILLTFASLYYMPLHPRICSSLYSISCLLDAIDGYAARYFDQRTRFGTALDMVTDRCSTTCLLVFLAISWQRYALVFQALISLDLASHYFQMYATLVMGGSYSHKDVDVDRSWLLNLYYTNKAVLFICCACNEAFFIALYLISFSAPAPIDIPQKWSLELVLEACSVCRLLSLNKLWIIAGLCFPVMLIKQFLNVLQLIKASRWLAQGDTEMRKRADEK